MQGEAMTEKRRMSYLEACRAHMTPLAKRNSRIFAGWSLAWAVSFVGASILLSDEIVTGAPLTWLVALAPTLVGLLLIRSYVVFLRSADELLRKTHLEGLAIGFGAAFLFMPGYRLFERLGAPAMDVSDPLLVLVLFWAIGQWIGYRRYL